MTRFSQKKKFEALSGVNYNRVKREYYLKKSRVLPIRGRQQYFVSGPVDPEAMLRPKQHGNGLKFRTERTERKKKYKINSYLFNIICKFPRRYVYNFVSSFSGLFGPAKGSTTGTVSQRPPASQKYHTFFYRPALAGLLSKKLLRSYYRHLSAKALRDIFVQAEAERRSKTWRQLGLSPLGMGTRNKNEVAKSLLSTLEQRLDSTLLRVLHSDAVSYAPAKQPPEFLQSLRRQNSKRQFQKPFSRYQVKSPAASFSALQVRQLIGHGHIKVNGKTVTFPGARIDLADRLSLSGYLKGMDSATWALNTTTSRVHERSHFLGNHKRTMLLRKFPKEHLCVLWESRQVSEAKQERDAAQTEKLLFDYIEALKIKRFTEIFYLVYRNMHLIPRWTLSGANALVNQHGTLQVTAATDLSATWQGSHIAANRSRSNVPATVLAPPHDLQVHIPVFDSVGYNQSIYVLWPLVSLLRVSSWMQTKPNFLRFGIGTPHARDRLGARVLVSSGRKAFEREQRNFLRFKRLTQQKSGTFSSSGPNNGSKHASDAKQSPASATFASSFTSTTNTSHKSVPLYVLRTMESNPTLFRREESRRTLRSYGSIAYGTKICKWVRLQQQTKKSFYDRMYTKINFLQVELEFFQFFQLYK